MSPPSITETKQPADLPVLLFSLKETAAMLRLPIRTLERLVSEREVPFVRLSTKVKPHFSRKQIDQIIASGTHNTVIR